MKSKPGNPEPLPLSEVWRDSAKLEQSQARITHAILSKFPLGSELAQTAMGDLTQQDLRQRFVVEGHINQVLPACSDAIEGVINEAIKEGQCDLKKETLNPADIKEMIRIVLGMYVITLVTQQSKHPVVADATDPTEELNEQPSKEIGWRKKLKKLFTAGLN